MRALFLAATAIAAATAGVVGLDNFQPNADPDAVRTGLIAQQSGMAPLAKTSPAGMPVNLVAQAQPVDGVPANGSTSPAVDESALRYFAAQGDTVRLQAEISRLRALYPGWQPPTDPLAIATGGDPRIDALWKLYADARYDDLDRAIADRQRSEPGWTPPAELVDSLRLARTRQNLVQASDAGRYQVVVDLAAEAPQLLTCGEVDMLWRVGEAFARTNRPDRARDAYAYILQNCHNPQERLATVEKASLVLDVPRLDELLRLEQRGADGTPEFDAVRDDIARSVISRGGEDAGTEIPASYVERLESVAGRDDEASDFLLLGWYFYRREAFPEAEEWFRKAYAKEESASAAQGLALTRTERGDPVGAESVLYPFRDNNDDTKATYLAAVAHLLGRDPPQAIDNDVLARMAPVAIAARNAATAEQFGWYARSLQQMQTAVDWFRLVLSWDATYEPAAYGLAVSLDALGDRAGVARIQSDWAGRSERIAALRDGARAPVATPRIAERPRSGESAAPAARRDAGAPRRQSRGCQSTVDAARLAPGEALTRGWCLMELGRPMEAVAAFDRALAGGDYRSRQDAAYGKSLAYLRLKMTDKAAAAATAMPQDAARASELQTAILADRAVGAFRLGRYHETIIALDQRSRIAPERQDLMVLRGFAYQKLGYTAEARRIFQALANVGNTAALRALADMSPG